MAIVSEAGKKIEVGDANEIREIREMEETCRSAPLKDV